MEDYRNMERCSGEPCCIFAERICADNEKEILKMEKDTKEKVTADEMMDDLIYLAELIDFIRQRKHWICCRNYMKKSWSLIQERTASS